MKKFITALSVILILAGISSCAQTKPSSPPDTDTQSVHIETTSSTAEIISEAFSPAYDPGMPDIYLRLDTTDIYNDTKNLSVTLLSENELITDNSIYIQKNNNGEWETYRQNYGSYSFFDNISVSKENPLTINIDVANFYTQQNSDYNNLELETRNEYRIMKKINDVEYYAYFTVGAHIPELKQGDVEISLSGADNLKVGDQQDITVNYRYVGNAEYADYGFCCEYTLEKLNSNGEWENVPFADNAAFIELGYNISTDYPTNSTTVYLKDDFYAEPLTAGTYRIVKPIEGITFTALFKISDNYNYEPEPPENEIEFSISDAPDINYQITKLTKEDVKLTIMRGNTFHTQRDSFILKCEYVGNSKADEDIFEEIESSYELQKQDENGEWINIPFAESFAFDDSTYTFGTKSPIVEITVSLNDDFYAEPLTEGTYRVVKPFTDELSLTAVFAYNNNEAKPQISKKEIKMVVQETVDNKPITTETECITISLEYTGNDDYAEYYIDSYTTIEKYEKGKWEQVEFKDDYFHLDWFYNMGSDVPVIEQSLSFNNFKSISPGKYRAVKNIGDFSCYAEFVMVEYPESEATEDEFIGCPEDVSLSIISENKLYSDDKTKELTLNYQYIGNEENPERTIYSDFEIHKLDENGKWQIFEFNGDIGFDDYVIKINKDNLFAVETITLYDSMFKKTLDEGKYRIVKALCDCTDVSAEFEIIKK